MKFICSKQALSDSISTVQKAVSTKTTFPILEGILIECSSKLKMTANDLELCIECYTDADIIKEGSIVVNSRMFGDIIRKLPDSEVLVELRDNDIIYIECEKSHFEIKGLSTNGFPEIPDVEAENTIYISQKILKEMIRQTIFAVSSDENRPILTGSLVEYQNKSLTIVSIDGFRLALRKNNINIAQNLSFDSVIPGKTLNEVMKILQPIDDEITIYSSQNNIVFDMKNCKVSSRLLKGEYLKYKNLILDDCEIEVMVNTKDMLAGVERASLVTLDEKKCPVIFDINEDRIILYSNTSIGSVREEISVEGKGNQVNTGFNPKYFIDALKAIENEKIVMRFTSNVGPCTLTPVASDDFVYMVLPVRLSE